MAANWAAVGANARIPTQHDRVFNEECIFCFDSPVNSTAPSFSRFAKDHLSFPKLIVDLFLKESPDGLYVCLEKYVGLGKAFVQPYFERTGNAIFVNIKRVRVPKKEPEESEEVPEKVDYSPTNN